MPARLQMGLKARTIAGCAVLLLLTVCALSSALIYQDYCHSLVSLKQYAINQARSVAYSAEPYVLLNETTALSSVLQAAASDKTLRFAEIVDTSGKVIASFARDKHAAPPINLNKPLPGTIEHNTVSVKQADDDVLVLAPIWSGTSDLSIDMPGSEADARPAESRVLGYVALLQGMDHPRQQLRDALLSALVIAGGILLAGIGASVLLAKQFLKPIVQLVKTARAIEGGDFNQRASDDAAGEIGILSRAFNQMAESLKDYTQNLEEQVRHRTAALQASEAEARQLAHAAEAANRAKSEFLANMSHEIRTPMTAILGFAESLDSDLTEAERREAICTMRRNGEHLLQIINDILDLSKIEAGKLDVELAPCSPCQVVSEVASLMRVRAEAKGLSLNIGYKGPIPQSMWTDATRLRQVLINLVTNAIKFTEHGRVRLEVQMLDGRDSEPQLQFEVIDTGAGMNAEQISNLFRPFTQVDNSLTRRHGGTGLGLAISKRITEMLHGSISVTSQAGTGSTFTVRVPTGSLEGVSMLEHAEEVMASSRKSAEEQPAGLSCRILLVEDGPDNQRLISFLLKKAGAAVEVAENGRAGADKALAAQAEGRPFDVILMDMQMPVLDGYAATRLLRQQGYDLPIIALTAHAMSGDRDKCVEAGCNDYATKPINRNALLTTIRKHLREGAASAPDACGDTPLISDLANDEELGDLVEMFVGELPARVEALQKALLSQQRDELRVLAHQLKGSAGGYGFPSITHAAKAVEDALKTQAELNDVKSRLDALILLCGRATSGITRGDVNACSSSDSR